MRSGFEVHPTIKILNSSRIKWVAITLQVTFLDTEPHTLILSLFESAFFTHYGELPERQKSEKKTKQNKTSANVSVIISNATRGAGLNPELMEQERQLGPEPSDADTPPPRRRRGAAANTQEESTEGVLVAPAMDVRASMESNASMCQTCMSSCTIDTSSWAATASCFLWERRKPFLGHAGLHDAPCSPG